MNSTSSPSWKSHFIELIIVIIGVTIAFTLNNIAISVKENRDKNAYLKDIRTDFLTDSLRLSQNIAYNEQKLEKLMKGIVSIQQSAPIDSVLPYVLEIGNYDFFTPDNFTLKSLLQSGDLKLINSEDTKKELLRLLKFYEGIDYMQKNFLQALDENYFPMLLSKVDMLEFYALDSSFFYGVEIKNYFAFTLNETNQQIKGYESAKKQINKVIDSINKELGDNYDHSD